MLGFLIPITSGAETGLPPVSSTVAVGGAMDPHLASSVQNQICDDPRLQNVPVLSEGRLLPLGVYAESLRAKLWISRGCSARSAASEYCHLSFGGRSLLQAHQGCDFRLRLDGRDKEGASIEEAVASAQVKARTVQALERDPDARGREKTIASLKSDLATVGKFLAIESGKDWKIPAREGAEWSSLRTWLSSSEAAQLPERVFAAGDALSSGQKLRLRVENWLSRTYLLMGVAGLSALMALVGAVFSSRQAVRFVIAGFSFSLVSSMAVLGARILVSERAPVTNMYETVLWFGLAAMAGAGAMAARWRETKLLAVGLFVNALALTISFADSNLLDDGIRPLVPALRSNFWLATHVLAVTSAYAVFGLSWAISNWLIFSPRTWLSDSGLRRWTELNRRIIQVGVFFLSLGIFLGAVWADVSWGRFWGWDPKETWSLITLIAYLALLHGRYAGWFKPHFFNLLTVIGFLLVIMTWFGVNWIFAKGLHSYGFSSGGAGAVIGFCLLQLCALSVAALRSGESSNHGETFTGDSALNASRLPSEK